MMLDLIVTAGWARVLILVAQSRLSLEIGATGLTGARMTN